MAAVKAIIQDCSVRFLILREPGCSVSGTVLPQSSVRHRMSHIRIAAAMLTMSLAVAVIDLPVTSPRAVFIQSVSDAEVESMSNLITLDDHYIMTSDGFILFVTEQNG